MIQGFQDTIARVKTNKSRYWHIIVKRHKTRLKNKNLNSHWKENTHSIGDVRIMTKVWQENMHNRNSKMTFLMWWKERKHYHWKNSISCKYILLKWGQTKGIFFKETLIEFSASKYALKKNGKKMVKMVKMIKENDQMEAQIHKKKKIISKR